MSAVEDLNVHRFSHSQARYPFHPTVVSTTNQLLNSEPGNLSLASILFLNPIPIAHICKDQCSASHVPPTSVIAKLLQTCGGNLTSVLLTTIIVIVVAVIDAEREKISRGLHQLARLPSRSPQVLVVKENDESKNDSNECTTNMYRQDHGDQHLAPLLSALHRKPGSQSYLVWDYCVQERYLVFS